jgi:hypothetical protein
MGVLGEGRVRWTLAVLLGCVALLIVAPSALALEGTGQIAGAVTKAGSAEGIEGIEVCAFAVSSGGEESSGERCAITGVGGEYIIPGLPGGEYDVEFAAPFESTLNYVTQYYNDKPSLAAAEPVKVIEGQATEKINAELQEGGKITGTVTGFSESGDVPLENIEVTAYEVEGGKLPVGYATTNEKGEYTIIGLARGSYKVEFAPGESGLNYVSQFYKDQPSRAKAEPVPVVQGEAKEGIDATLQVGGEISGTVSDAWTHAPVSNVYVVALGSGEAFAGVADTNASGKYTILGLATGEYKIEFIELGKGSPYIIQYYNDEPALASANPVTVNQGSTTPGIDAALVRKEPVNTVAPVVSGTPAVGQTLSCSTGAWTGEPAPTYTYVWLRNGATISGASAGTYGVQAVDQGAALACRVTATNKSGNASAASNTLMVPIAPPPSTPKPEVKLLSARILVSGGSARVPISCAQATCTGMIELTERIVIRRHRHGRTRVRRETLVLGRGVYALNPGHSATISLHLTRTGEKALARVRHHRLLVTVQVSVTSGTAIRGQVVLSEVTRRHHRRR